MAHQTPTYHSRPIRAALPGQDTLGTFAAAFFTFALICDWAYVQTMVHIWRDFASWMLFAGLVCGGVAGMLWLIGRAVYRQHPVWGEVLLRAVILVLALINSLIHAGDGWTAIMPWGLRLSLVTVALMVIAGVLRRIALPPTPPA